MNIKYTRTIKLESNLDVRYWTNNLTLYCFNSRLFFKTNNKQTNKQKERQKEHMLWIKTDERLSIKSAVLNLWWCLDFKIIAVLYNAQFLIQCQVARESKGREGGGRSKRGIILASRISDINQKKVWESLRQVHTRLGSKCCKNKLTSSWREQR